MQTPVRVFLLSQKGDLDWSVRAMDKLYTVNEAAEFLGCSARTIRRMVGAGELPAVPLRVGSGSKRQLTYWRVRQSTLEKFIRAREQERVDTCASIGAQKRRERAGIERPR